MQNIITSFLYGVLAALSFVLGCFLLWKQAKKEDLQVDLVFDLMFFMVISAIGVGRLFFILEHFEVFSQDFFRWIHFIRYPGISANGAFFGSLVVGLIFLMRKKVRVFTYLDILVFPLLYVQLFLGVGCLINGCVVGAKTFPNFGLKTPLFAVHPLALYYIAAILFFIILFKKLKEKKWFEFLAASIVKEEAEKKTKGLMFLCYILLYCLLNFILEYLFRNALYFKNFNLRLLFNLFTFILCAGLFLIRLGPNWIKRLLITKLKEKNNVQTTK
jgi:prolipoprotein diacylglyceryltransferase